jgi:hypothetical protein
MNPVKKGNLLVLFVIAIIAFGASTIVASATAHYVQGYVNLGFLNSLNNDSNKMLTVDDGLFTPLHLNKVIVVVNNSSNSSNINGSNGTIPNGTNSSNNLF